MFMLVLMQEDGMKGLLHKLHFIDKKEFANLSLFSLGKFISVFGSSIYAFAVGLFVLELTGSGLSFATTLVFGFVPIIIFSPIGGVLADKFNKKTIVIVSDLLNGLLFIAVYFMTMMLGMHLVIIYVSTFLSTTLATIFATSIETAKPNIVSDKKLLNINAISKIIDSSSAIAGPVLGGLIFAFIDLRTFILINGVSFILSAVLEMFINFKFNSCEEAKETEKSGFIKDIKSGIGYIKKRKDIVHALGVLLAINFFLGFSATVPKPYIVNIVFELSSYQFGIIEGALPVGLILGALFVKKVVAKLEHSRLLALTSTALSICILLLAVPLMLKSIQLTDTFYFLYYMILSAVFGVVISFIDIPIVYYLQKTVAEELRGRVLSISMSFVKIISPVAVLLSGLLLNTISTWIIVLAGGGMLLFINIIILKHKDTQNNKEVCVLQSEE